MKRTFFALILSILLVSQQSIAVYGPTQTITEAKKGKQVHPETIKDKEGLPVEFTESGLTDQDLPARLQRMKIILNTNARHTDTDTFDPIDLSPLGPYDPIKGSIVYIPYIPMPTEKFSEFFKGVNMSDRLKKFLFFRFEGKEYARFFIHPSRTSSYQELINKYGIVRDEIPGFLAGSPRSFEVYDPSDRTMPPFIVKTSLHFKVMDDLKINIPNKLHRSYYTNSLMAAISQSQKNKYNFDFLPESVQMLPDGKQSSTFFRELTPEYFAITKVMVPGYYLTSPSVEGGLTPIEQILARYQDKPRAAAEVLRPLLRLMSYLVFDQGLKGEMHEQNVDFEIEKIPKVAGEVRPAKTFELDSENWGRLSGRIIVKDLDSFRTDTEQRLRKGYDISAIRNTFKPFVYTKFFKASGWGDDEAPVFSQEAYDVFIRDTFGYSFGAALGFNQREKNQLRSAMGEVLAEEISLILGRDVKFPRNLEARESWLDEIAKEERDRLNQEALAKPVDEWMLKANVQKVLRSEFERLRQMKRTTGLLGSLTSARTFFVLHDDLIEARFLDRSTGAPRTIGYAALEPKDRSAQIAFSERIKKAKVKTCLSIFKLN